VAPSVQRRKVWLTPTAGVSCNNADKKPVEISWGAPNYRIDLSRWAEVHHIVGMSGHLEEILLLKIFSRLSICALIAKI